jgi:hypothetical protein
VRPFLADAGVLLYLGKAELQGDAVHLDSQVEDLRENYRDEGPGALRAGGAVDTEEGQRLDAIARKFYGKAYAELCELRKGTCRTLLEVEKRRLSRD